MDAAPVLSQRGNGIPRRDGNAGPAPAARVVVHPRDRGLEPRRPPRPRGRESGAELHLHELAAQQVRGLCRRFHGEPNHGHRADTGNQRDGVSRVGVGPVRSSNLSPRHQVPQLRGVFRSVHSADVRRLSVAAGGPLSDGYPRQRLSAEQGGRNVHPVVTPQSRANLSDQGDRGRRRGR